MSRLLEIDSEIYELQSVLRKILVVQNEYEMVLKLGSKWASWKEKGNKMPRRVGMEPEHDSKCGSERLKKGQNVSNFFTAYIALTYKWNLEKGSGNCSKIFEYLKRSWKRLLFCTFHLSKNTKYALKFVLK